MKRIIHVFNFGILLLAFSSHGDVGMIEVTKASQAKNKVDWMTVSITEQSEQSNVLICTATLSKDVASRLIAGNTADGVVTGVKVQIRDEKQKPVVSVPVMIKKQKDEAGLVTFSTTRAAIKNCVLEVTFAENISKEGPLIVDIYSFKLFTYIEKKKAGD
jgi:hypothetical protein